MFRFFPETSKFIFSVKKLQGGYCNFERRLEEVYKNSQIYKLANVFGESARVNLRYSFLRKITEMREESDTPILSNSRFIKMLSGVFKEQGYRIINCVKTSTAMELARRIKKELYFSSVKEVGIIVFVAALTNIIFSLLFHVRISLIGGVVRGILLLMGFGGLFCDTPWRDLKETSAVLKGR